MPRHRTARRCARIALVYLQIASLISVPAVARANPLDPTVAAGTAAFQATGSTLSITTSDRAIIDWQSFGINPGETTHFIQPGATSAVLNRVIGNDPSALLGTLQANGQVFLINPHGIVIGQGAQINAGSFMATTLDIDNALFMRGGDLQFQGDSQAAVVNYGAIRALEGNVYLVANRVENHGIISATGNVGLAATNDVRLVDGAHPRLVVRPTAESVGNASGGVQNTGMIEATKAELIAAHGNVYALAINNTGTVRSNGVEINDDGVFLTSNGGRIVNTGNLVAKNSDGSGGQVVVDASGKSLGVEPAAVEGATPTAGSAVVSGTIDVAAEAAGKTGGDVQITAGDVELAAATINADGAAGGGVVRVGGDYQGGAGNADAPPNAATTSVDTETNITADATQSGDGGKIIIWADGLTKFAGTLTARGAAGGRGGFAEVSGKQILEYAGSADLGGGTLLLDPTDFTINATVASSIVASLNAGTDVTITTSAAGGGNGDVFISSAVAANGAGSLSIFAHRHVYANASVTNDGTGELVIVAGWDGVTQIPNAVGQANFETFGNAFLARTDGYGNNGGNFIIDRTGSTTGISVGGRGTTLVAANNVLLTGSFSQVGGYAQIGHRATTAILSGGVIVRALNDVVLTANKSKAQIGAGVDSSSLTNTSVRGGGIDIVAGRDIRILGGYGDVGSYAVIGNGGYDANSAYTGDIYVKADRNLDILAGTSNASYAQLGNGGAMSEGSHQGDIRVQAETLTIKGGDNFTYAMLGHGGNFSAEATDQISGAIRVEAATLDLNGGSGTAGVAQLGHGGNNFSSSNGPTGNIDITVRGEMSFDAVSIQSARVGHWAGNGASSPNSPVQLTVGTLDRTSSNSTPATSVDVLGGMSGELRRGLLGGGFTLNAVGINGADVNVEGINLSGGGFTASNTLTVKATGNISFAAGLSYSGSGSIRLIADGTVFVPSVRHTSGTGTFLARADADGDGVGVIQFNQPINFTGSSGQVVLQYRPSSYATPRDFIAAGNVVLGTSGATLNAQMLVNTVEQLQAINTNLAGSYILGRDIDATATSTWNSGAGFKPIGAPAPAGQSLNFSGKLDGDGRIVSGLTINRPSENDVGLMHQNYGQVFNLRLESVKVTGQDNVGAFTGSNSGTIDNVSVTGGVTAGGSSAGGIVGQNLPGGVVSRSYSAADVTAGFLNTGGIAGLNRGNINRSYFIGSVRGWRVGGVAGSMTEGTLTDVYSSGKVTASFGTDTGGLVGRLTGGTLTDAYYDLTATTAGGAGTNVAAAPFTQSSYAGFDFTNEWYLSAGNTRPILRSEFSYEIRTSHQLQLAVLDLKGTYTVTRDIDLSETRSANGVWNASLGFNPLGTSAPGGAFSGKLIGGGRTLDQLFINRTATNYTGMFAYTRYAEMSGLRLTNVDVTGGNQAGGFVGFLADHSRVSDVETSGVVKSNFAAGGVVGYATLAEIDNSKSSAVVTGTNSYAGGLIGYAEMSKVTNSSATGSVTGNSDVGGLIGSLQYGVAQSLTASGSATGQQRTGGLVGLLRDSLLENVHATGGVARNAAFSGNTLYFGGLVGFFDRGSLSNASATGNVQALQPGFTTDDVGGLIGRAYSAKITEVFATGNVAGSMNVGGLIGNANAISTSLPTLDRAYATGDVDGTQSVGGLVGRWSTGTITRSYATGDVTGAGSEIGGLVGRAGGTIRQTYATGIVSGPAGTGGLLGLMTGQLFESYSRGAVTPGATNGGLIGTANASATNSFWDTQTSGMATSFGGVGKTSAEMKTASTFTSAGWDFASTWTISSGAFYPLFQWQGPPGVLIQGNVFTNQGVTAAGAGLNVTLLLNGVVFGTATTNSSGGYSFSSVITVAGDALLAYLNDNPSLRGATAWRGDGEAMAGLNIFGSTLQATAANKQFASNSLLSQAAGAIVDPDLLFTANIVGADVNLGVAGGIGFLAPAGQTYRLDGNLSTAGGNVSLLGNVIVASANSTIRTDAVGGTTAAGSVLFAASNGAINGVTSGGQSLTINTKADGGGSAGTVRLTDVGTTTRLNGITVASGLGLLQLADGDGDATAEILVTTGNVDFSDVADVQHLAHVYINTRPTAAGQGNVLFQLNGGEMVANAVGRNLTIDTRGLLAGVADDGNVSLPASYGTNTFFGGAVDVNTDRGVITMGTITFATWKTADTGAGYAMRFASANTILTGTMTIESSSATLDFDSTTFSSNSAGRWTLNLRPNGGFGPAGEIRFAGADNFGGNYLALIELNSDNFFHATDGRVVFIDERDDQVAITTEANVFFFRALRSFGNNLVLGDSTVINSVGTSPGIVELMNTTLDASADNLSLTVNIVGPGSADVGHIDFGTIGRDTINGGGRYLGSLTATTSTGQVLVDNDITIDHTLGAGAITFNGPISIIGARTITTQVGDENAAGSVTLNGLLYGRAAGSGLTINASGTTVAGGNVELGNVGRRTASDFYLRTLDIDARGTAGGAIVLNGSSILLDASSTVDLARLSAYGGGIVLATSVIIDTENGTDQNGGAVDFGTTPLSATAAGFDLTISTSALVAGAITTGDFGNANVNGRGGFYVNDVTFYANDFATMGLITTGANVLLDTAGSDIASLTFSGRYVLNQSTRIDTESGNDASAGSISLQDARVSASAAGVNLTLDTSTAKIGSLADVTLGTVDDSGGFFVNDLTIDTRNGTGFTPGSLTVNAGIDLAGQLTFTGGSVQLTNSTSFVEADAGIDIRAIGNAGAFISMADGSVLGTSQGDISLVANSYINLSLVNSNSDAIGVRGDVFITADADGNGTGGVFDVSTGDVLVNIFARNLSISAGANIGTITDFAFNLGEAVEANLSGTLQLARVTSAAGQMNLRFSSDVTAGANSIVVGGSNAASAIISSSGSMDVGSASGALVLSSGDEVFLSAFVNLRLPDAGINVGTGSLILQGTGDVFDGDRSLGALVAQDLRFVTGNAGGDVTLATNVASINALFLSRNAMINETSGLSAMSLRASSGNIGLTTGGAIVGGDFTTHITANVATIQAGGSFGSSTEAIKTNVVQLNVNSGNAGQWITETDGLTALNLSAGTGAITLTAGTVTDADADVDVAAATATLTLTGALGSTTNSIGTSVAALNVNSGNNSQWIAETDGLTAFNLSAGIGMIALTAGGALADSDAAVDIAAATAIIELSGDFGATGNAIGTNVNSLSVNSGNGSQWIAESSGLTAINLAAGTGAISLTAGAVTDTDADVDIAAATATLQLSGAFGSATNSIGTSVAGLTINSGTNSQWIAETDGLTAFNLSAGTGMVTLTAGGALADTDAAVDVAAATAIIQLSGDFGATGNAIGTNVNSLSVNSGNASQWIAETDGLTALNLAAGTGSVVLNAGGAISDADADIDVAAASATIQLNGAFGSSASAIRTSVDSLTVDSGDGGQWIAEVDGLTALDLSAGSGSIKLTTGGSVFDLDDFTDLAANSAELEIGGAFGTSANPIGLNVGNLALTAVGDLWLSQVGDLASLNINAGTNDLHLVVAGSIFDFDADIDVVADSATIELQGDLGHADGRIGTWVNSLSVNSDGGDQRIDQFAGLSALALNAGTGNISLIAGGAIVDADADADLTGNYVLVMSSAFGSVDAAIGTAVTGLTVYSGGGDQWIGEADSLDLLHLDAGGGDISLVAGGSIATGNIIAHAATIELNGDFGSADELIRTAVAHLTVDSNGGNQWIAELDGLAGFDLNAGAGNIRLTAGGAITDADALADIVAEAASIELAGAFGSASRAVGTTVASLGVASGNGDQWIDETDGLTALNLGAGTGSITLTTGGAISDADADVDIAAATAGIYVGGTFGSATDAIGTSVAGLSVDSGDNNQWIAETDALTALNLTAGTGAISLSAGSIADTDADLDITAADLTLNVVGAIGSASNPLQIAVARLSATAGTGLWLDQAGGLDSLYLKAGNGVASLIAGGSIQDEDDDVDILAPTAIIDVGGAFGSATNSIHTDVANLSVQSHGGDQWIDELSDLLSLNLQAGDGSIALAAGGAVRSSDQLTDIVAASAKIDLNGDFGTAEGYITTAVATLAVNSGDGGQWIAELDGLTALDLNAGTGSIRLTAGGSITDVDGDVDLRASVAELSVQGSFGAADSPIGTSLAELKLTTTGGSQWLREIDGLKLTSLAATGVGAIINVESLAGDVEVVNVAAEDRIRLTSHSGAIRDAGDETSPQITAEIVDLQAAGGIGATGNGDLDILASRISALNSSVGGVFLEAVGTDPVSFESVAALNADGAISLKAAGDATLVDVRSAGGAITAVVAGDKELRLVNVVVDGDGSIDLSAGGDVRLLGEVVAQNGGVRVAALRDTRFDSDAAGRSLSIRSLAGNVEVVAGRDVRLVASAGRQFEIGSQSGDVGVSAGGDVELAATAGGVVRIGGRESAGGALNVRSGGSTRLSAEGGASAVVGHLSGMGDVVVVADKHLALASASGGTVQIGHLMKQGAGDVDVAWNQAFSTGGGSGMFTMSRTADSLTSVTAGGGALGRVRLFGGLRDDFVFLDRGIVINTHPFSGVRTLFPRTPEAASPGSMWDQNIQYFNWPIEQWNTFTLNSPGPETSPFTFYFYSDPPGLDVGRQAIFFNLLNGMGFEYERAYLLLDGLERWINVDTTAEVNGPEFDEVRRNAVGAEITGGSSL